MGISGGAPAAPRRPFPGAGGWRQRGGAEPGQTQPGEGQERESGRAPPAREPAAPQEVRQGRALGLHSFSGAGY